MTTREIISTVLHNRNIKDVDGFLNPPPNSLLPFSLLNNIDVVADRIIEGVNDNKSFLIHFDVDVDGCSAGAIMYRYLKKYTDNVYWQINQGKEHGIKNLELEFVPDILIIVDSINEYEDYKPLLKQVSEVIVIDHHIIPQSVAESNITLVSSANNYPNSQLSGAGIVWKVCKYIDNLLLNNYADNLVDLASCGIIADMCAVDEAHMENRYICSLGFANPMNVGIKKINGNRPFNSQSVSFGIAPLVNAACRVGQNKMAVLLFISDDPKEISRCIKALKTAKEKQKEEVATLTPALEQQVELQRDNNVLFFEINSDSDIAGLMANQMLSTYGKPCFVLRHKDGKYSGSCRATGVEDFNKIVSNTQIAETGGHNLAFGVSVAESDFNVFKEQIIDITKSMNFSTDADIDIQLNVNQIDNKLITMLKSVNMISGQEFPPITVMVTGIDDYSVSNLSQGKHLRIMTPYIDFIKWNFNGNFNEFDNSDEYVSLSFVGVLDSSFFGRQYRKQLIINDYHVEKGFDI